MVWDVDEVEEKVWALRKPTNPMNSVLKRGFAKPNGQK
jgi:hypothetical protein